MSQERFDQLISAYFAAPTDHMQRLEFSGTDVQCSDISDDCSPIVDQHYLQFKMINLDSLCQFVTIDLDGQCQFADSATPTTISSWLGQSVSEQKSNREWDCLFKVNKETSANPRKRTASAARLMR